MNIISILGPRGPDLNWNKAHKFLQILSISGKIMVSYVFQHKEGAFWHFLSKTGRQKHSGWAPKDPLHAHCTKNEVFYEGFLH